MSDAGDPAGGVGPDGPSSRAEWERLARRLAADDLAAAHGPSGEDTLAREVQQVALALRDGEAVTVDDVRRLQVRAGEVVDRVRATGREVGDLPADDPALDVLATTLDVATGGALAVGEADRAGAGWARDRLALDAVRALGAVDRLDRADPPTDPDPAGPTPGVEAVDDAIDGLLSREDVDRREVAVALARRAARVLDD